MILCFVHCTDLKQQYSSNFSKIKFFFFFLFRYTKRCQYVYQKIQHGVRISFTLEGRDWSYSWQRMCRKRRRRTICYFLFYDKGVVSVPHIILRQSQDNLCYLHLQMEGGKLIIPFLTYTVSATNNETKSITSVQMYKYTNSL